MKRLYLNPVHGQQRIHIELTSHDISDILEAELNDVQLPATRALTEILEEARDIFGRASATGEAPRPGAAAAWQQKFPIGTHPYEGFGFEAPCTARGYGTACGATEYDHTETT